MSLHPECYHSYLLRRVERLYHLVDVQRKNQFLPELRRCVLELRKIEACVNR